MGARLFFGAARRQASAKPSAPAPAPALRAVAAGPVASGRGLLTTAQVRDRLGLGSINAVYARVRDYGLPRVDIGGAYRFDPDAVDQWLASRSTSTTTTTTTAQERATR